MLPVLFSLALVVPCAFSADLVPVFIWDSLRDTPTKFTSIPVLSAVSRNEFRGILDEKLQDDHVVLVFAEENLSIEDLSWQDESGHGAFPNLQNLSRSGEADLLYLPFVDSPLDVLEHMFPATPTIWNEASLGPEGIPILSEDTPYSNYLRVNLEDAKDNDDRPELLKRHDLTIADIFKSMREQHSHVVAIYTAHHSSWHVEERIKSRKVRGVKEGSDEGKQNAEIKHNAQGAEEENKQGKESKNQNSREVENEKEEKGEGRQIPEGTRQELNNDNEEIIDNESTRVSSTTETLTTESPKPPTPSPVPEGPPLMTIPILSGLMVTSILLAILSVAIAAMMDIKPTLRFDDPKGKTLSIAAAD